MLNKTHFMLVTLKFALKHTLKYFYTSRLLGKFSPNHKTIIYYFSIFDVDAAPKNIH